MAMIETLKVDQRRRWQQGDRVRIQEYLERYPELAADSLGLTALLAQEIELRTAHGETPHLEEYLLAFPQCEAGLRSQWTWLPTQATDTVSVATQSNTVHSEPAPADPQAADSSASVTPKVDSFETVIQESQGELLNSHAAELTNYPKISGFEILGRLGQGGMGVVYRAKQIAANRIVALKVVRSELLDSMPLTSRTGTLERFRTEAQAAAQLQHDNLVAVYEIGEVPAEHPGGCPLRYYAMRFVDGCSLFEIVSKGPVDNKRAATYLEPVARALQAAHDQGILHRDLKPQNIMIDRSLDRPLVTDFGLAKFVEGQDSLTYAGEIMGTPSYMSPEQAQDAGTVTASADVYSLGATLYHLLTGRPPFQASSIAETIRQILDKEPVAPTQFNPSIDRDLETICLKCLRKEPSRRYASCADLAEDLALYLSGRPIIARPVGYLERAYRWCRRNPIAATLSGTALALALSTMLSIAVGYRNVSAALQESETRLQHALQVVDELFTRVSEDELLNEPGMQPLRKDLLEKALKHYQYFLAESGEKDSLLDEVAAAHFRVGIISQTLGEFDSAEKELLLAEKTQVELLKNTPTSVTRLKAWADTLNALGRLYDDTGKLEKAARMFADSTKARGRLVLLQPNDIEFLRLRANAIMNLGLVMVHLGNYPDGLKQMQAAQAERQSLLQAHPDIEKLRRDQAMGWYSLGKSDIEQSIEKTDFEQDLFQTAIGNFQKAIDEFTVLVQRDPRSMNYRYYLGVSHRLMGGVLDQQGQTPAALKAFEAATDAIQSLAVRNPEVTAYQRELAMLAANRGACYWSNQEPDKSKQAWQEAIRLTRELVAIDPANTDLKIDLATSLSSLGFVTNNTGEHLQAKALFVEAKSITEKLLEAEPQAEELKMMLSDIRQDIEESEKASESKARKNQTESEQADCRSIE